MSRIEEALRRAGTPAGESSLAHASGRDAFVSPWSTVDYAVPFAGSSASTASSAKAFETEALPRLRVVRPTAIDGFRAGLRERLAVGAEADPVLSHEFRRLAATLIQAQGAQPLKTVMITSAAPGDGKTLTALNLSLVLSESFRRRVLLIEGDLRRPTIANLANLSVVDGLSEALKANNDRKVPLVAVTDRLTILAAGRPCPDPLSGLTSARMQRLLHEAADQYDWVILDSPPVGAAADAGLLCPLVDAVLLVVRAGETSLEAVQHAVDALGQDRILGVVLNAVEDRPASSYDSYYSGHVDPISANG